MASKLGTKPVRAKRQKTELTDSTYFLVPPLGITSERLSTLGFINAYMIDKDIPLPNNTDIFVYLLFKPEPANITQIQKLIDTLEEQPIGNLELVKDYDYEGGYVVLLVKFPERYREDYELFLKGSYSKFSLEYKSLFPEHVEIRYGDGTSNTVLSTQHLIFNRDPRLKKEQEDKYGIDLSDAPEIWRIYSIDRETLDIDKIKLKHEQSNNSQ